MLNVRKEIAARLLYEFGRRNLTTRNVAELCNMPEVVISKYLAGKRDINIDEIKTICGYFNINSTRLLFGRKYPKAKLAFRNSSRNVQGFASVIEDIFFLIKDSLPDISSPQYERKISGTEKTEIITEAATFAKKIKSEFSKPQDFLHFFSIPVVPCYQPAIDFDAFLVRDNNKALICVNSSSPPHRIQFSLAHEISHIIFDIHIDIPVDTFLPNFYWKKWLTKDEIPEFFAYKFAEFYLISFDDVYTLAQKWPQLDLKIAQQLVESGITTKEVLANALFDTLLIVPGSLETDIADHYKPSGEQFQRMDWEESIDDKYLDAVPAAPNFQLIKSVLTALKASSKGNFIHAFLKDCQKQLLQSVEIEKEKLSDDIYDYIMENLSIGH